MQTSLLISTVLLALGIPQGDVPVDRAVARAVAAHDRAVWAERALAFLEELATSSEEARVRAQASLERPSGAGTSWYPPLAAVMAATRELTGPALPDAGAADPRRARELRELQALADMVDLIVVPGGFVPRAEGRGEPITVFVRALARPAGFGELEMRLFWRSRDGREERARAEPTSIDVLRKGFSMYVRPPLSEGGNWWLLPELAREGLAVRGAPVRVGCAAEFSAPFPLFKQTDFDQAALRDALEALRSNGARSMVALDPLAALDALAQPPRTGGASPPAGGPRPLETAFEGSDGSPRSLWGYTPQLPPGRDLALALVILCADHELADLPLAGILGRRWRELADGRGALLLSVNTPPAGVGATTREVIERAITAAHQRGLPEGAPVVAIARGATAARLAFQPIAGLDAAVLCTVVRSDPREVLSGLPRLLVGPGGAGSLPDELDEFTWVDGQGLALLDDLELPALVDAWLAARGMLSR